MCAIGPGRPVQLPEVDAVAALRPETNVHPLARRHEAAAITATRTRSASPPGPHRRPGLPASARSVAHSDPCDRGLPAPYPVPAKPGPRHRPAGPGGGARTRAGSRGSASSEGASSTSSIALASALERVRPQTSDPPGLTRTVSGNLDSPGQGGTCQPSPTGIHGGFHRFRVPQRALRYSRSPRLKRRCAARARSSAALAPYRRSI